MRRMSVVFLLSLTLVGLELIWTRLLSAEFFHTFAFLVLSLAIAGLGMGALAVRAAPRLGRDEAVFPTLALTGACALAGPPLAFWIAVDFSAVFAGWLMIGKLLATVLILGSSYFFGGVVLANLFRRSGRALPGLYGADLVGAGLGVIAAIVAMNRLGADRAAFWMILPVVLATFLTVRIRWSWAPIALVAGLIALASQAGTLLELDRPERAAVVYKHWDAMAKIKMYGYGGGFRGLNVDNVANSPVFPFDGDFDALDPDAWDINVRHLVAQFDSCRFLSLGSGGGSDVLQALNHGATEVHAVEVNPHINRLLLEGDPGGYTVLDSTVTDSTGRLITCPELTGNLYRDPRVIVASDDARSYVRRHPGRFDVIYSLSSNTWAALGSGAFALAENYLFTTEAFTDYWYALSDDGFLSMEHQVYMPRLVTMALDGLRAAGVAEPREHVAVYELPVLRRKLLLISKRPLTDDFRYRAYGPLTPEYEKHIRLIYPAPDSLADNLVNRIVLEGWRTQADSAAIDLSPSTDDRPFVAQMGLWKNFSIDKLDETRWLVEFRGFPLAKLMIVIILAVSVAVLLPAVLAPYFRRGPNLPPAAGLYFFLIGVGFMLVEIVLIQKYALLIGASALSLAAVLATLLLASGLGSLCAARLSAARVVGTLVVWILLEAFLFRWFTGALAGASLGLRVGATALLIAPLGFLMGVPFPKGGMRVGELVDWGFAVNGVGSVVGGAGAVLLAMTQGFTVTLVIAAGCYGLAGLVLTQVRVRSTM